MKKGIKVGIIIGYWITAFIICIYIGNIYPKIGSTQKQKFNIFQSYSFMSGDYRDTTISVIVNEGEYDRDSMFEEVKDFHNILNGEPDELTIRLYHSRNDCKSEIVWIVRHIIKSKITFKKIKNYSQDL